VSFLFTFLKLQQINKSISKFLAQNRARNDASNRNEFLDSAKRKQPKPPEGISTEPVIPSTLDSSSSSCGQLELKTDESRPPSCARTDARPLDRDVQMKYDIARNEDGPLRRTLRMSEPEVVAGGKEKEKTTADVANEERLNNIETHLAIRYGMHSLPSSFHNHY
jgi:hypothetical protein